jgi:hypothetical protein
VLRLADGLLELTKLYKISSDEFKVLRITCEAAAIVVLALDPRPAWVTVPAVAKFCKNFALPT